MNRRFIRTLIYVLVAGQVLLSAPVTSAMGQGAGTGVAAADMPCADSMQKTDHSKPCPCCPDGVTNMAACLSACAASAAGLPASSVQIVHLTAPPALGFTYPQIADFADPPLKPPPIA